MLDVRMAGGWRLGAIAVWVAALVGCVGPGPAQPRSAGVTRSQALQGGSFSLGRFWLCAWFGDYLDFCQTDPRGRRVGQREFVSAGIPARGPGFFPVRPVVEKAAAADATVEEGDIYRVVGQRLLNLNYYRGLQVIDLSDLSDPHVMGRLPISGQPVELYVHGDRALVLLNGWRGYYGARDDVRVERVEGGLVLLVDLSDPSRPSVLDRQLVRGHIRTSRLVREGADAALYVASQESGNFAPEGQPPQWSTRTLVRSFTWEKEGLSPAGKLDLGGSVTDIQATPQALLVARTVRTAGQSRHTVAVVDIAGAGGRVRERGEVQVQGRVRSKFNMDLRGSVLRVVSGRGFGAGDSQRNHLETFDISKPGELTPIDDCAFGAEQDLFATLFLQDRALFVTYRRVDPYHAFALSPDGRCEERSEFVVSGWNDYFRAVFGERRLIGIGVNDADGRRTASVSLYDITDLDSAEPLLARANVRAASSWSSANWDDKAFSVVEDAVSVAGRGGVKETGLVLLPFTAYDEGKVLHAVQIYTFSESTLTPRGVMNHGSSVQRSFLAAADTTGNLSTQSLSFFDTSDPDEARELGRLELAPNYTQLLPLGEHTLRVRSEDTWSGNGLGGAEVQVLDARAHPDRAKPVARFAIARGARVFLTGTSLVTVHRTTGEAGEPLTEFNVHDLSDARRPKHASRVQTDRLLDSSGGICPYCLGAFAPPMFHSPTEALVVGDALVFAQRTRERERLSSVRVCSWVPPHASCDSSAESAPDAEGEALEGRDVCPDELRGSVTCRTPEGGSTVCEGAIMQCAADGEACREVDSREVAKASCWDDEQFRFWNRYTLHVLDVSDPTRPVLGEPLAMPEGSDGVGVLTQGTELYFAYKREHTVEGDTHSYAKYYVLPIDFSLPRLPRRKVAVNVPGRLMAVSGGALFTLDDVWQGNTLQAEVNRLSYAGASARLLANFRFPDRRVGVLRVDENRHVYVASTPGVRRGPQESGAELDLKPAPSAELDTGARLTILSGTLDPRSELEIDSWATLREVRAQRALFEVPGGLLMVNVAQPSRAFAQAYFPVRGWPSSIQVDRHNVRFAAGRFGVYAFSVHTQNLLE